MTLDQDRVRDFARSYADAWGTHDPAKVAAHYVPGGKIEINGGEPTEMIDAARGFIDAFPDIQVLMDDVRFKGDVVEFHWTFTGTNTGPGGTGKSVRISGFEEWIFGDDGLIVSSKGNYDQAEYDRQLEHGAPDS
jgi:hypothetical protein